MPIVIDDRLPCRDRSKSTPTSQLDGVCENRGVEGSCQGVNRFATLYIHATRERYPTIAGRGYPLASSFLRPAWFLNRRLHWQM